MRHKQYGGTGLPAKSVQQIQNALLHRHIQRAGRLVGNNHVRSQGNGDGNQHALFHAAGELMRILFHALFGVAQPHFSQQGEHLFITLGVGHFLV